MCVPSQVRLLPLLTALAGAGAVDAQSAGGSGPHKAVMRAESGLPTHTVYRPRMLRAFGGERLLPVVSWGNGGCVDVGDAQRNFLTEIASHGMLVLAPGPIRGNRPLRERRPAPPADPGNVEAPTRATLLTAAIDWAIAENSRADSDYFGRIDVEAVALMGYSCGGLQALSQAQDPRVRTLVLWNSGVPPADERRPAVNVGKDMLTKLTMPVAYFAGGPSDLAYSNAADDVSRIRSAPVFFGNLDVGHGGTYFEPNGGAYGRVAADWLRWQLTGDATAARTFVGPDCGLCTDAAWTVERHGLE